MKANKRPDAIVDRQSLAAVDSKLLAEIVDKSYLRGKFPGCSVTVIHDGGCVHVNRGVTALGSDVECTTNTRFPIACISSLFLSQFGDWLERTGQFRWDEMLSAYLPNVSSSSALGRVTARQLLVRSSGLDYQPSEIGRFSASDLRPYLLTKAIFSPGLFKSQSMFDGRLLSIVFEMVKPAGIEGFLRDSFAMELSDIFSFDTRGSEHHSDNNSLTSVEMLEAPAHAIEWIGVSSAQLARLGRAFCESAIGKDPDPPPDIDDHRVGFPTRSPFFFNSGTYFASGHVPGHVTFVSASLKSNVVVAGCSNSSNHDLYGEFMRRSFAENADGSSVSCARLRQVIPWHVCTDGHSVSGTYIAQGDTLEVVGDGKQVRVHGNVGAWPPKKRVLLMDRTGRGIYVTSASTFAKTHLYAMAMFISLESDKATAQYLRFNRRIYRNVAF